MDHQEIMSKDHKNVKRNLKYVEHFLILASAITGLVSISTFVYLLYIPIGVTSSEKELKVCAITARIKRISQ